MLADDHYHAINSALHPYMYPHPLSFARPHRLPVDSWEQRWNRAYIFARACRIPDPTKYANVATFCDWPGVAR